jgi:hypothetical protein
VPLLMMHWGQVYISSVDQCFQRLLSDLSPDSTSTDAMKIEFGRGGGVSKATIWMFNPLRDEKGIERLRDED